MLLVRLQSKARLVEEPRTDDHGVARLQFVEDGGAASCLLGKAERTDAGAGLREPVKRFADGDHVALAELEVDARADGEIGAGSGEGLGDILRCVLRIERVDDGLILAVEASGVEEIGSRSSPAGR